MLPVFAAMATSAVSSAVTLVTYDDERVSLRLDRGESVTVDRAIVTLPLGVLKSDTPRFSPPLPYAHQHAIAVLETGAVDVVWLRFEEAFWRAGADGGTSGAGPGGDGSTGPDGQDAASDLPDVLTVVSGIPRVAAWLDVGLATGEPVLVGVIAATQVRRLEALDDQEFLEVILADLAPFATARG